MIKIRAGMFETNSSSVHAMVIAKEDYRQTAGYIQANYKDVIYDGHTYKGITLVIRPSGFGWENRRLVTPEDKASYLMTIALLADRFDEFKEKLSGWFKEEGIKFKFKNGADDLHFKHPEEDRCGSDDLNYYKELYEKYEPERPAPTEEDLKKARFHDILLDNDIYIDHFNIDGENTKMLDYCLSSFDNLSNFLFNNLSYVWTGNDNSDNMPNTELIDGNKAVCFVKEN